MSPLLELVKTAKLVKSTKLLETAKLIKKSFLIEFIKHHYNETLFSKFEKIKNYFF